MELLHVGVGIERCVAPFLFPLGELDDDGIRRAGDKWECILAAMHCQR